MPRVLKLYAYDQLCHLTKNLKLFYYSGRIMGVADIYEQFIFFIGTDTLEQENKIISDLKIFIKNKFESSPDFKDFHFFCNGYPFETQQFGLFFYIVPKFHEMTPAELYPVVEKIEEIMYDYVKQNNLEILTLKERPELFEKLAHIRKFDPRNPDPNYMFFVRPGIDKPYEP